MSNRMKTESLVDLTAMPDSALLSGKTICNLADRSRTSLWRDVKAGYLPEPIRIGANTARWRADDVRAYLSGHGS